MAGVIERLEAFVLEQFPFAVAAVQRVAARGPRPSTHEAWMAALENELRAVDVSELPETTPSVAAPARWLNAVRELLDAIDGFFAREAIAASLTRDEKLEIMRGMVLMRALDNRLKLLY
jgi:hypothetical protein